MSLWHSVKSRMNTKSKKMIFHKEYYKAILEKNPVVKISAADSTNLEIWIFY